jgi:hypothetical protein
MIGRRNRRGLRRGRRLPFGVVLIAMLAAASLPIGVATALVSFDSPPNSDSEDPYAAGHGPHEGGYNANRRPIAHGDSVFGPYALYASSGPEGTCVELELPDRNPPGGGRAFYSDCSSETTAELNAATVSGEEGAVVYGLAPKGTKRVQVDRHGGQDLAATVYPAEPGDDRAFFVESTSDTDVQGVIWALDADGRQIGARPVP